jgi:conjugal transfer pilus assembly protein TraB
MKPDQINSKQEQTIQWIKLFGLLLCVVIGVLALILIMHKNDPINPSQKEEKAKLETPMLHVNDGVVILEKAQKKAADVEKKAIELEKQIVAISQAQIKAMDDMRQRMDMLEKTSQGKQQENAMLASLDPLTNGAGASSDAGQIIRRDKLNLVSLSSTGDEQYRVPTKNPDTYVPAGTFVQGVIIEGADAAASVTAQTNPEPMLIRLTANGTLPNRRRSHLKDCVVTLAASGDISSERGKIRAERLSCVKPGGGIIDIPVEGNVAGPDGKNGMRGNPVWRENALLQRAFTAGALSGISDGISQTYTTNSISPLGNTQTTNNGKILQVGVAKGTGKAMDKLADYNIQRAEQYHPVIQLSAGTVVDVVFLKGFFLDGKKHSENEEEVDVQTQPVQTHSFFPPSQNSQLPLTPEQVARLDQRSKELGLSIKHSET